MKTFQEWLKEQEVVMGNRCVKNVGPDAQVQGDPCASAKKKPKPTK